MNTIVNHDIGCVKDFYVYHMTYNKIRCVEFNLLMNKYKKDTSVWMNINTSNI